MILHVPQVLSPEQVLHVRQQLEQAGWADGRLTAGYQSAQAKRNLQLPEDDPLARELGGIVLAALAENALFMSAALPATVYPPLFNCYREGDSFGMHVDNAIRDIRGSHQRLRTDLSATLFLSEPDSYDGGELVIDGFSGASEIKLPAGDLILYPSVSLHRVNPVTRGQRMASFFWVQSLVRDQAQRTLLLELDLSVQQLTARVPDDPALVQLVGVYHNLLRRWTLT